MQEGAGDLPSRALQGSRRRLEDVRRMTNEGALIQILARCPPS